MSDDYLATTQTAGQISVGGTATGNIETSGDRDWFAVELVAGREYRIDLEGWRTEAGTLTDPHLRGIHDANGDLISGTTNNNGGVINNSRVTFTASETGTYYIAAGGHRDRTGTYTLSVSDITPETVRQESADDVPAFGQTVSEPAGEDFSSDISTGGRIAVGDTATGNIGTRRDHDWFAVELETGREYRIDLRGSPTGDGTLSDPYLHGIHDAGGNLIPRTTNDDGGYDYNSRKTFTATETGTHYIAAGAYGSRRGTYELEVRDITPETARQETVDDPPAFGQPSYTMELAENAAAPLFGIDVGQVSATDPEGDQVTYSIVGGDPDGLFAIDETGYVVYVGSGEDYESGTTRYELTVRASAGTDDSDVTVIVNVLDVEEDAVREPPANEAPVFASASYAFDLPENAAGDDPLPLLLGPVQATDPEDDSITYSIESGNPDGLFAIDPATGALSYQGPGEDYESGTTRHELTVRASDGTDDSDVTVTVNVLDVEDYAIQEQGVNEAPVFTAAAYFFGFNENVAGDPDPVSLGSVEATDPEGVSVTYSIMAGNSGGLFAIDPATGALSYRGPGEDHESGTSHELTVRASAGTGYSDVTVTVSVGDVEEAPAFGQDSYAFDLPENAAGNLFPLLLGPVEAQDPEDDEITYSIQSGDPGGLFAIDPATGALSYLGSGEDYESETTRHELTVRASAGTDYSDVTVTVNVTDDPDDPDEEELVSLQQQASVSEPDGQDLPADVSTTGVVAVGGSVTGEIGTSGDRDWFAVTLEADRTYRIDLKGSVTNDGTLDDPYLRGIHDASGGLIPGTTNDDRDRAGSDFNSRVDFTATANAVYYVAADDPLPLLLGPVEATDPEDDSITYSIESGDSGGLFAIDPGTGALSYVGSGEDYESGTTRHELTVRASDGTDDSDVTVIVNVLDVEDYEIQEQGVDEAPVFTAAAYFFGFNENVAGDPDPVSLGSVEAEDPEDDEITYSIQSGNPDGLFAIDSGTGALSYRGPGEDHESGTSHELTVRASAGTGYSDVTVTVSVGDVEEAPAFGQDSYAFDLPENAAGNLFPLLLGPVEAQDPEDDEITYSIQSGDPGGLFAIDPATGALSYLGSGEDYESETTRHELTVRASAGTDYSDVTVTVNVTDDPDDPDEEELVSLQQQASVSEPDGQDLPADVSTTGVVAVGGSVTGEIGTSGDRDWFAVTLEADRTYRIDLEGLWTYAGTLFDPYLHGIHDAEGNLLSSTTDDDGGTYQNSRMDFTATEGATYYVAAGAGEDAEGTYTLFVTDITNGVPDDFVAGTDTIGTVAVGGSSTGEIQFPNDRDWFAVTLEAGKLYRIDLEGAWTDAGTLPDPYLRGIHDAEGNLLVGTTNDDGWSLFNSRVYFTATEGGTYYVAAGADQGAEGTEGTYTLSVTEIFDDYAAGTGTRGAVAVGGSSTGEIDYRSDLDWFAVALEAGKIYRIDLEGRPTDAGTLSDPYLHGVYDAAGDFISGTTNDDGGAYRNSRVFFTATEEATYYVAAGAFRNSYAGTYTLSVTEIADVAPDDFAAGTDTGGTVAVGASATGEIETPDDRDWFAVTLAKDRTYRIDLEGSPTGAGTLRDPYLRGIHDANGDLVTGTTNDDGGADYNSRVDFTATENATYYVAAGAFSSRKGTYTVSVTDITDGVPDDFAAGTGTLGAVAVGGSANGEIEYEDDRDWFAVTLEAGKTYRIDLEGSRTGAGTLRDPYLRGVHDANGDLVTGTTNDDGGAGRNSRVDFTATENATYYVAAGALGDAEGTYTLSVDEVM